MIESRPGKYKSRYVPVEIFTNMRSTKIIVDVTPGRAVANVQFNMRISRIPKVNTIESSLLPSRGGCGWIGVTVRSSYTEFDSPYCNKKSTSAQVVAHEFGHSIGLGHSGLDADKMASIVVKRILNSAMRTILCFMSNKTVPMTANPVSY